MRSMNCQNSGAAHTPWKTARNNPHGWNRSIPENGQKSSGEVSCLAWRVLAFCEGI
jgi:hypothetical protein